VFVFGAAFTFVGTLEESPMIWNKLSSNRVLKLLPKGKGREEGPKYTPRKIMMFKVANRNKHMY
jgi:hypothetical protein